ncbi:hypothetical protein N0V83_001185 [Neocucurbitaria cava]|uniref:Uncharacterized protein n=1 Tax=Neocucurbitaria cava TaxID=798079 RepID=A0A9W9CQ54_9PLEO|nr:hypothetical protein N0V83_001185 [Neocucurbitaria cava]
MPISGGQVYDIENYIEKLRRGISERAPNPAGVAYVPYYDLDGNYGKSMDKWYKDFPTDDFGNDISFSSEEGSESSVTNSGHKVENVDASLRFGWLRISVSSTNEKSWSDTKALSNNAKVTIKLSCKQKQVFSVNPGKTWSVECTSTSQAPKLTLLRDVPAYTQLFPNTKDGLVPAAKNLVQTTGMLCVSGLRLSAQFDSSAKEVFDTEFKEAKNNNGALSFFGISIDANSSPDASKKQTHSASWDKNTGTLSFEPTSYVGNCTLLAMIGSKSNIV